YSPFVSVTNTALDVKARDLDLSIAPGAYVHLLPNIAGFVGSDHVAMLLATKTLWTAGPQLAIDIGTNTEVSLIVDNKITCVSCASGPAFEGSHIKDGMPAASGAIERLRIENNQVEYETINDSPPLGLCGSGILDAVAQLYLNGIIHKNGRMQDNHPRVHTDKKQREFVLLNKEERNGKPPIVITQQDIRQIQLAKSAIQTGIQVLLKTSKIVADDLEKVIIAGAFGNYIDVANAITIGMLPLLPLKLFQQVGNAAGMGAKLALVSSSKRDEAQDIRSQVRYIELSTAPNFSEIFIQANRIGTTNANE
ncbi:ASKHA domain-containing protein, partial [Chloroflexota bacterium]